MDRRKQGHPGYAVRFHNGTWLAYGHGWTAMESAQCAKIFSSQEWALDGIKDAEEDGPLLPYTIVVAWEPLCESLRAEVEVLKQANSLDPDTIQEVVFSLESAIAMLQPTDIKVLVVDADQDSEQ